jgi:hypothetical protein
MVDGEDERTCVMKTCLLIALLVSSGAWFQSAQDREQPRPGDKYLGTWTGTWDGGGGSGGIEVTLERDKEGVLTGNVSVTGEPTYKAAFKTVSFDGSKMTAAYDFPPEPSMEVVLAASFDGNSVTGTWSARGKADASEVANGTWKATKK